LEFFYLTFIHLVFSIGKGIVKHLGFSSIEQDYKVDRIKDTNSGSK